MSVHPIPIVICGGHLAPALAIINSLKHSNGYLIHFIGRKHALEADSSISLEYQTCQKLHIPFHPIITGRLQRFVSIQLIYSLVKIPVGFLQSFYYLLTIRPKTVVCFGGYLALPICAAAFILHIPVIVHEQTHILGLCNKIITPFAKVLCITWSDTKGIPDGIKTIHTGNPIRNDIEVPIPSTITDFGDTKRPLLYITGGSLGSHAINECMSKIITQLVRKFRILHQCGSSRNEEDYKLLLSLKNTMPYATKKNFRLIKNVDTDEVGAVLHKAMFVICRSGANTVHELLAVGVPSIVIPLPWAGQNEQTQNAQMLVHTGSSIMIEQKKLTPQLLLERIMYMHAHIEKFKRYSVVSKKLIAPFAADTIIKIINEVSKPSYS